MITDTNMDTKFSSSGEFDDENVNVTRVECNGLLGSAGEDTKVNK